MADLPLSHTRSRSVRLDMTPLVDLAFLLLSFFILTTSMQRTHALQLVLPSGGPGKEQRTITVLLASQGTYWYSGDPGPLASTPERTTATGLRRVLMDHRQAHPDVVCIVRTAPGVRYREVIAVLDELDICGLSRYTVMEGLLPWEQGQIPLAVATR